jgi:hypothetical protein
MNQGAQGYSLTKKKTEGQKSRDTVPLIKNDRRTTYNRKFDMKTAIFLKMDKVKQI